MPVGRVAGPGRHAHGHATRSSSSPISPNFPPVRSEAVVDQVVGHPASRLGAERLLGDGKGHIHQCGTADTRLVAVS
jgi:hypothetical protein